MRIIALTGAPNCGKTTTLALAYNRFLEEGTSMDKQLLPPNDFSDIILFRNERVAFYTMGDYQGVLLKAIGDFNILGIDLLICACNDKPALRTVRNLIEKFDHDFYEKTLANPRTDELMTRANNIDVNAIFALI